MTPSLPRWTDLAPDEVAALLGWRREVAALYARVRERRVTDPEGAHAEWLGTRARLYREHPQSPVPAAEREGFGGLDAWPYDPAFARHARLEPSADAGTRFPVATSGGGTIDFLLVGRLDLGDLGTLDAFWLDAYGGGLLVPFRDATAGTTTYGGGRYALDTAKGADLGTQEGALVVDLNFAYHPSCVWDPRWACPLAPPGNRLTAAVEAGERLP